MVSFAPGVSGEWTNHPVDIKTGKKKFLSNISEKSFMKVTKTFLDKLVLLNCCLSMSNGIYGLGKNELISLTDILKVNLEFSQKDIFVQSDTFIAIK